MFDWPQPKVIEELGAGGSAVEVELLEFEGGAPLQIGSLQATMFPVVGSMHSGIPFAKVP